MRVGLKALLVAAGIVCAGQAAAQVTLFEHDGFQGNHVTANHPIDNFANSGFNDTASSVEVRGGPWQVCTDAYFEGRCVVLRPGTYPSLSSIGLNDRISSVRPVDQYGRADERSYTEHGPYADRRYNDPYYYGPRDGENSYYDPRGRDREYYRGQ